MSSPNETDVGILSRSAVRIATASSRAARIRSPSENWQGEFTLLYEPAEQSLLPRGAVHFRDGFGEGNSLRAGLHAILGIGAILNAAGLHQGSEPFLRVHRADRMHVEEPDLADDGCANEFTVLVYLRADFQATSTGNAIRKRIAGLLDFRRYARAFAQVVGSIDRNPRLHALQAFEHELPVDREVAHQRKFAERLDANRLLQRIHERGACHACFAIYEHRARTANLFQAV